MQEEQIMSQPKIMSQPNQLARSRDRGIDPVRTGLRRLARKRSGLFIIVFGLINLALSGQVRADDTDTFYGFGAGNNYNEGHSRFRFWLPHSSRQHPRQ